MAAVNIPDRICSHCGGTKWNLKYLKKKLASGEFKTYEIYVCSKKQLEQQTRYKYKNISKYRKKYRESIKNRRKTDKAFANKLCQIHKTVVNNLPDWYIRKILTDNSDLTSSDIPQELVELKHKQLLLTRTIKNQTNGN